jgi:hypothetical protein
MNVISHILPSALMTIYGSTALEDLRRFFSFFFKLIHDRYVSLDGGSALRNAATYTQNNRNK